MAQPPLCLPPRSPRTPPAPQFLQTFVLSATSYPPGPGRDRPRALQLGTLSGSSTEGTASHRSHLSRSLSQPVPTARAGAALPRSLRTPGTGGTPGPPGTTTSYASPLCSGTPTPSALPAAPIPGHLQHPQPPAHSHHPRPPSTFRTGLQQARPSSPALACLMRAQESQLPGNCPHPAGHLCRFTSQRRASSPIRSPVPRPQQLTLRGPPGHQIPACLVQSRGTLAMGDSSAGAHGGSPPPSAAPSRPHRAAHGSLQLPLRPPPL